MADESTNWGEHVVRGLAASTRHNALAYGYSLALTGAFGILVVSAGGPHPVDVFLFGIGAAVTFTLATAATTRGFRRRALLRPALPVQQLEEPEGGDAEPE